MIRLSLLTEQLAWETSEMRAEQKAEEFKNKARVKFPEVIKIVIGEAKRKTEVKNIQYMRTHVEKRRMESSIWKEISENKFPCTRW